jgi:hypothetical protein
MTDPIVRQILGLDDPKPRNTQRYKGVMCFDNKTAPSIQVMTADSYNRNKQYYVPTKGRSAMKRY